MMSVDGLLESMSIMGLANVWPITDAAHCCCCCEGEDDNVDDAAAA